MTDEEHAAYGFTWDQARSMRAELERELGDRRRYYPAMIRKARMTEPEAARNIAIFQAMLADTALAFAADLTKRRGLPLADRQFHYREKVAEIRRELAMRERVYPDRIAKHRLTEQDAKARNMALQLVHDLYWRKGFAWEPESELAREEIARRIRAWDSGETHRSASEARDHYQRTGTFPPLPAPTDAELELRNELQQHFNQVQAEPVKQTELAL